MKAGASDKFREKYLHTLRNTNMATQRNLDVVSNTFRYCQCPNEHDITQNQISDSCHYRITSASFNMYEYTEEDFLLMADSP